MVKHIVLWKIKDDENKQKNIDSMIEMLTALVGKIDGLVGIEMGYNFDVSSEYDVVLYASFKNAVALKYYQNHPEHIKCKEFIGKIATGRTSADYFWEEEISAQIPFAEPPKTEPKSSIFKKKETTTPPPPMETSDDTWTCPNCGKVMPSYVGTCGCGEPKPFEFEFTPNSTESKTPETVKATTPPPAPKSEPPKTEPKPSIFKKKETTTPPPPMETSDDTWTCPNCGKVMPNYVGTCGCGEPKPFEFEFTPNSTESKTPETVKATTPPPAPKAEPPKAEPKPSIFKKKETTTPPPPMETSDNVWTCPNCGKVMPNYVGTCGCGEPKPFEFKFKFTPSNNAPVETSPVAPVKAPEPKLAVNTASYNPAEKISRKPIFSQTDNKNQSDSWICQKCGKVLPNYVGTCGCGESKPFGDFVDEPAQPSFSTGNIPINPSEKKGNLPDIQKTSDEPSEDTYETQEQFSNVEPSLPSYNPQIEDRNTQTQDFTQQNLSFIKNDSAKTDNSNNYNNTSATDLSFIKPSDSNFSDTEQPIYPNAVQPTSDEQNNKTDFNDEPENSETNDGYFFNFDNMPPPAPMRFNDAPPPSMHLNVDSPNPMKYEDTKQLSNYSTPKTKPEPKPEKKHLFGKKAKDAEALRKAEEIVNSRKDVPNDGTWTCPNCGKVMPKYVGTCGCGEQQPFDF